MSQNVFDLTMYINASGDRDPPAPLVPDSFWITS